MYYIDQKQIEERLQFILYIVKSIEHLEQHWSEELHSIQELAQERLLHLAIESITDIGSYMIDGLMMREASSYEDIIEVLFTEKVFDRNIYDVFMPLVNLRKPLVQEYITFPRGQNIHSLLPTLPEALIQFSSDVRTYLSKELI